MLEEKSGIPVVGVAPYLNIQVEDEDSLTERFETKRTVELIDIAVIRVPRISNFTDFNPLERIFFVLRKEQVLIVMEIPFLLNKASLSST